MSGKNEQDPAKESNAERDQDAGNMNNGTIGADMDIKGSSNDQDEVNYSKVAPEGGTSTVRGDTDGGANNGSVGTR